MPETLEILVSRLERAASELRSGDLEPQPRRRPRRRPRADRRRGRRRARPARTHRRPATRTGRAARAAVTTAETASADGDVPGPPPPGGRGVPRGALRFGAEPATAGSPGGDALLAARRRQADPARARARDRPRRSSSRLQRAAARGGARAHPHLLADPRRPAGDGRRRPAPRPADLPQGVRRGRRDPRRRRPLRRGVPPRPRPPAGRAGAACWPRSASSPPRPGSTAWSAASTSTCTRAWTAARPRCGGCTSSRPAG